MHLFFVPFIFDKYFKVTKFLCSVRNSKGFHAYFMYQKADESLTFNVIKCFCRIY